MQHYSKYIFLILLCICTNIIKAQVNLSLFADSIAKQLNTKGIDTIIVFEPGRSIQKDDENLKGIGHCSIGSDRYLFYSQNAKDYIIRIINCRQKDETDKMLNSIHQSEPFEIKNDSSLTKIKSHIEQMQREKILPCIYRYILNGNTLYDIGHSVHGISYSIVLYAGNKNFIQEFEKVSIMRSSDSTTNGEDENLNYTYNINTSVYKSFKLIEALITSYKVQISFR